MTGADCPNLPGYLFKAVSLLDRNHRDFGRVPDDLIAAVGNGFIINDLTLLRTLTIFCSINIVKTENYSFIYLPG